MSQGTIEAIREVLHGVYLAAYDNCGAQVFGHACPFIECECGWSSSRALSTWEDVGREFDEHLASA